MKSPRDEEVLFREVQHFHQLWIWAVIGLVAALSFWGLIQQVILGQPFGNNPASNEVIIIIVIVIGCGLPAFFYFIRLITEVRRDGVYVRYFPFQFAAEKIGIDEIASFKVREYRAIKEFGGWGIRYSAQGKAYNVSGNRGVQLEFINGKQLLIGSRRAEDFARAIETAKAER